ncbi:MAG: phosphoribosylanthranilate isomerase [Dehalococcoidales bacterium]|nr:phosphoribosylanthranilate isomerase [Dehalococcoidales bacterium]
MQVKICGLMDEGSALAAAAGGADLLGFVFAPSRRRVTPNLAREIIAAVRVALPQARQPRMVGVFVDECPLLVDTVATHCGLDYVQLSGHENPAYVQRLQTPSIVARPATASLADAQVAPFRQAGALILLDAMSGTKRGGTGQKCDWAAAARVARAGPILLAGGLTPANVAEAIQAVGPWGVDVSSGVETAGRKDPAKITAFVQQAKRAGSALRTVAVSTTIEEGDTSLAVK